MNLPRWSLIPPLLVNSEVFWWAIATQYQWQVGMPIEHYIGDRDRMCARDAPSTMIGRRKNNSICTGYLPGVRSKVSRCSVVPGPRDRSRRTLRLVCGGEQHCGLSERVAWSQYPDGGDRGGCYKSVPFTQKCVGRYGLPQNRNLSLPLCPVTSPTQRL